MATSKKTDTKAKAKADADEKPDAPQADAEAEEPAVKTVTSKNGTITNIIE